MICSYLYKVAFFMLLFSSFCFAAAPVENDFKLLKKQIEQAEKQTKDKIEKARLKAVKKQIDTMRKRLDKQSPQETLQQMIAAQKQLRAAANAQIIKTPVDALTQLIAAAGGYSIQQHLKFGMQIYYVYTPEGVFQVMMPDDPASGEFVSGTSFIQSAADEQINHLQTYRIDLNGLQLPAARVQQQWSTQAVEGMRIKLISPEGTEIAATPVQLVKADLQEKANIEAAVPEGMELDAEQPREPVIDIDIPDLLFQLSPVNQAGNPVEVRGSFDGDAKTTYVAINKEPARIIAESRRKFIAENPRAAGRCEIRIEEADRRARCIYHNLDVRVWSSASTLTAGANAALTVQVDVIPSTKSPLQVVLQNQTPEIVSLQDGAFQRLALDRAGSITFSKILTGMHNAPFFIEAWLDTSQLFSNCESAD